MNEHNESESKRKTIILKESTEYLKSVNINPDAEIGKKTRTSPFSKSFEVTVYDPYNDIDFVDVNNFVGWSLFKKPNIQGTYTKYVATDVKESHNPEDLYKRVTYNGDSVYRQLQLFTRKWKCELRAPNTARDTRSLLMKREDAINFMSHFLQSKGVR